MAKFELLLKPTIVERGQSGEEFMKFIKIIFQRFQDSHCSLALFRAIERKLILNEEQLRRKRPVGEFNRVGYKPNRDSLLDSLLDSSIRLLIAREIENAHSVLRRTNVRNREFHKFHFLFVFSLSQFFKPALRL